MPTRITRHSPTRHPCPLTSARRSPARAALALVIVFAALLCPESKGQQSFIYALTEKGNLSVNATVLDKLPAKYNAANPATFGEVWWDLLIDGSDRYALRLDGSLYKNGEPFDELPFTSVVDGSWLAMTMANDQLWALRNDGQLARDGAVVVDLPNLTFFFQNIVTRGNDVFSMRSDGAVFRNVELAPVLQFVAGPGVISGAAEGEDVDSIWRALALDPLDNELYALRNDGKVVRGDPDLITTSATGVLVAELPFDPLLDTSNIGKTISELYPHMTFLDDGTWVALNGGGEIYEEGSHVTPLVDLPGDPAQATNQRYIRLLGGAGFLTIRSDGHIYLNSDTDPLVDLPKNQFRTLASSDSPPDLTSFKNSRPIATRTKATALEGQAISVPVHATDVEKTEANLQVTADLTKMPAGATWNIATRSLDWANPGPPGKYKFVVTVDDGETKAVVSKNTIAVKAMDTNPAKNRKPSPAKVKKAQALVGVPLELPILATDRDGDPISITVDETKHPFSAGATFDPVTNVFSWTPGLEHIGKHKVVFFVSDGTATKKLSIKMTVISSLLGI